VSSFPPFFCLPLASFSANFRFLVGLSSKSNASKLAQELHDLEGELSSLSGLRQERGSEGRVEMGRVSS